MDFFGSEVKEFEGRCLLAGYISDTRLGWLGCFLPPAFDLHYVRAQLEVAVCISQLC